MVKDVKKGMVVVVCLMCVRSRYLPLAFEHSGERFSLRWYPGDVHERCTLHAI
jgi:hypothetical protein